jgi:serralysin
MLRSRRNWATVLLGACFALPGPAGANHHLWDLNEIFSDSSGDIQFIEFRTTANNQNVTGIRTLASTSNSFLLGTNLPSTLTANKFFLVATAAFASLPGAPTPDFIMPGPLFFSTGGDTINYASGADVFLFGAGVLPTDGVTSLNRNLTTGTNSPTNFAGQTGSVTVPEPAIAGLLLLAGALSTFRRRR